MASKRELLFELFARDKTGPATKSAADNLAEVGDAADDAADSAKKLGDRSEKAEDKTGKFGRSARTAAQHVKHLDSEIENVERELRHLAVSFTEAATAADRLDISKAIRRTQSDLKKLKSNKGLVEQLIPPPAEIATAAAAAGKTIAITAGAALAPILGGVVSSAIIGGAGAAGVLGGVLLVSKDPRVKAAGAELGKNLLGDLTEDAGTFVEPVLEAIDSIGDRANQMRPTLQRIFANSSKFVEPLTDGITGGVEGIVRGIDKLISRGAPVIDALSDSFDILGNSTGDAFEVISGGSEDAATSLRATAEVMGSLIEVTGYVVRGLTEIVGVAAYVPGKILDAERAVGILDDTTGKFSPHVVSATGAVGALAQNATLLEMKAAGATGPIVTLGDEINGLAEASRNAFDAQTSVGAAMDATRDAIEKNGQTLSANTEEGRANRSALSDLANALIGQYNATVKVNGEGEKADAVASRNRDRFIELATAMTGSKKRAEELATQLGLIPGRKKLVVDDNFLASQRRAKQLQEEIDRLHGKNITIRVTPKGEILYGKQAPQLDGRAAGGPVKKNTAYLVGEKRPEVFVPDQSGTIIPSVSQFGRGAAGGGMGYDGSMPPINIYIQDAAGSQPSFAKMLRYTVRVGGGPDRFFQKSAS